MGAPQLAQLPSGFQLEDNEEKFNKAADFTFGQEGGYMVDKGRPTNYGIRQDILDQFNQENGAPSMSVTDLTPDDARYVAKKAFFEKPGFDKLPGDTATVLFDYGFNSGPRTAIKALQKTVGATPDGDLGPNTLKATQNFIDQNGEKALLQKLVDQRQQNYNRLLKDPSNHQWKNGWNNRIKKIKSTFQLAADTAGQGIDALLGTGTANADEIPQDEAAQLPQGFQIEDGSAQAPVSSPSPAQAARGAMAVRGLPVLNEQPPASVADAIKNYVPPAQPDASQLPDGFNLEDQISQGKKPSLVDKIQSIFSKPPEQRQAEAANIYAISKSTGLDPLLVEKHYDKISKDSSVTGLTHQIDNVGQLALGAGAPFLAAGAIEAPIATAAGAAAFSLLDKFVDLKKFVPSDANDTVKSTVEAVDFIGKALATHGIFKTAPKLAEAFTKQKIEDFKLPSQVKLSGEQVRDIYQTGKLTTPEQVQLYSALDLSREEVKNALSKGIDITIPTSKIVTLTDKPWWAKVKGIFGQAPDSATTTSMAGKPTEALKALPAPEQAAAPVHPIIAEAQKHGTVVGIDAGTKLPIIDTSKPATQPALPATPTATPTPEAAPATPLVNDPAKIQTIKDAIANNERLLQIGKQDNGYPLSITERTEIKQSIAEDKRRIGELPSVQALPINQVKNLSTDDLENHIDARYEANAPQKELDALETAYANRVTEEDLHMSEDDPNVQEDDIAGSNLNEALVNAYHRYLNPDTYKGLTKDEFIGGLRGMVEEMSNRPIKADVTNEQVLDAAKHLYEQKQRLLERQRSKNKEFPYTVDIPTKKVDWWGNYAESDIGPQLKDIEQNNAIPITRQEADIISNSKIIVDGAHGRSMQSPVFRVEVNGPADTTGEEGWFIKRVNRASLQDDTPENRKAVELINQLLTSRRPFVEASNVQKESLPISQGGETIKGAEGQAPVKAVRTDAGSVGNAPQNAGKIQLTPEVKKAKLLRRAVDLIEGEKELLINGPGDQPGLRERVNMGDAGRRDRFGGSPSTFPSWFQNKGYNKKDALNIIDAVTSGRPITDKQRAIYEDMRTGYLSEIGKEIKNGYKIVDTIRRQAEGEGIKQSDITHAIQSAQEDGHIGENTSSHHVKTFNSADEAVNYASDMESKGAKILRVSPHGDEGFEVEVFLPEGITPSGGVRPQLQTPIPKSLFQEKGELFDGKKTPVGDFMAKEDVKQTADHLEYAEPAKTPQEFSKRLEQLNKFAQSNAILRRGMKSKVAAGSFTGKGKDIAPEGLIKIDQKTFLSDSQYVSTLAHELGHAIEHAVVGKTNNKNLKLFGDNIDAATLKKLYNELMAVTESVSPGGLKAQPEYYAKPAELIARFFQKMIESPGNLEDLAPTAVKMIEQQALKHPIIDEFLEATRNGIDKGAPKIVLLRDLRETYQKYLGKRVGNIAYGEELAYRAMKERGKYVIEKFVNEKFKGIKDSPESLFRAAESIKTSKGGVPEFGTRDYVIAHSQEEADHLTKMGWEKMPTDAYENGIKYPLYGRARYTPEQSRTLYEGLSLEGQKLVSDFAAERKEAKDYFNRETIAETNKIDRTIEGWVHHYFEDTPGGSTMQGGKKFKKKLAASRKHREGALGYVEDFKKAMTKALIDLEGERVYNDFIQRQFARVTKPLPEGKQPDKGWVEVVGDTKSGAGLAQEKNTKIVDSATGKSFRPNYAKYQMPAPIYERYKLWKGLVEEASTATRVVNDINRYWRVNILAHPGTAMTNFISGGVQYSAKILTDFYKEVLTAQATMPQTRRNISAMLKVLMPKGWMDAPDWVYGSDLSNFYGQFMKQESVAGKAIDTYANGALKLFGSVERYWKKVLITSEGMGDLNKLTKMTPEGLKLPTKEEREMLAEINKTVDLYAYDYDNVPLWMEAHQKSAVGQAIKPFAKWPYKYMKQVMDMIGSAFDQTQPWQDRVAKIMALSTIVALYAGFSSQRKSVQQTPQVDPNLNNVPARFQTRGRVFVTTDDKGNEIFMRTSKYPFIGLTEAGMQAVNGNFEGAKDAITDMLGGVGPMGQVGLMALSYTNKYQQYTPVPVLIGQNVASFIPLSRILGDVSRMLDPYQRKQETFGQTFGALVPTTDGDLQEKLHGKVRTEKVPIEGDIKAPPGMTGKHTTIETALENHWQDIGLSLLSGIYVSRIDPAIVQAYITRGEKNQAKREEKKSKENK